MPFTSIATHARARKGREAVIASLGQRLGITTRITLLWVALFAVGLGVFAILAAAAVQREQREALDADLSAMARVTARSIGAGKSLATVALPSDVPGIALLAYERRRLAGVRGPRPPDDVIRAAANLPNATPRTLQAGETYRIVVAGASIETAGLRIAAVAVQSGLEQEADQIRNGFVAAALPMILIVGVAGWFVARRSLAPIGAMTAVATEIARSGRLSMRVGMDSSDELGRLSQTFDTMLAKLEASFTRERGFIGNVSHELRNAIGAIAAEAELAVSRSRGEDAYRVALETIATRARRVAVTVDDLLLLARADAGILDTTQHGELNDIVSRACAEVRGGETAGTPVAVVLWEEPIIVVGYSALVTRLIENLVVNACRAAKTIVRVRVTEEAGYGVARVEDDGPGIPAEQRATVFRRFYRGDVDYSGSGLGLSIAAAIATSFGGEITIDEGSSGGACFRVTLPIAIGIVPEDVPPSSRA